MPWLFSLAASEPEKAILVLDSKDGEIAIQAAPMLARMGRKVAVIDDMGRWPELEPYRVSPNPFGAAVSTYLRDGRDLIFANETISNTLIPEPSGGQDKNKHFRDVPREVIEFCLTSMMERDPALATPGAVASILTNPDVLRTFAQSASEEGSDMLQSQAQSLLEMVEAENWGQHLTEAKRSVRLFGPGTRLHDVGKAAEITHEDLIREGYVVFLVGPQKHIGHLSNYYALHIMAFRDAVYEGAGALRALCDEFTNTPLKELVASLTTLRAYGPTEIHMIAQSRSEIVRRFGEQECLTIEENAVVKLWFGFSSIEEAKRVSDAIGEQHAVASSLSGESGGMKTNTNLSLIKQKWFSEAELMAMPPSRFLGHIKGVGYFMGQTLSQQNIAPYCHLVDDNPLEGGTLSPEPTITLVTP